MPLSPSSTAMPARSCTTLMFGLQVDAAGADAPRIGQQPDRAVAVRTLQLRLRHQVAHDGGVGRRQAQALQGRREKAPQRLEMDAGLRHGRFAFAAPARRSRGC